MKRKSDNAEDVSSEKRVRLQKDYSNSSFPDSKTKSFDVVPVSRFNLKFPYFRQPVELGAFSLDENRTFVNNRSQLRTYKPPISDSVNWNLRFGYDTFIRRDESVKEYLDHLLEWIRGAYSLQSGYAECLNTDFVCWRGLLTKLLCTPFENREGWKIAISRYKNTFYMCEFEADEAVDEVAFKNSERQKEMTYWGFKFETFITSAEVDGMPNAEQPVNNKQAFVSVVRTRLNDHSLVFGGEVDCCEASDSSKYIELKTSRLLETPNQHRNFKRYKLIKWWAQSFLIGISKIVCGFRDDDGIVRQLKEFSTRDLPKYCQDLRDGWSANVCFNFLDKLLQHIKDVAQEDCDKVIYVLSWSPGDRVTTMVKEPQSSFSFLPVWYTGKPSFSRSEN